MGGGRAKGGEMSEGSIKIDSVGVEVCEEVGDNISIIGVRECLETESLPVSILSIGLGEDCRNNRRTGHTFIHPTLSPSFSTFINSSSNPLITSLPFLLHSSTSSLLIPSLNPSPTFPCIFSYPINGEMAVMNLSSDHKTRDGWFL